VESEIERRTVRGDHHRSKGPWAIFTVLWAVFFLQGMMLGFWVPALTNILGARGLSGWVPVIFMVSPLCALISPMVGGALADQRVAADRLFAWSSILASLALAAAFGILHAGGHPLWFCALLACWALMVGPSGGLLATVSLTHLSHGERQFPLIRVGATIGWICGGLITSFVLKADASPVAGYAAAAVYMVAGGVGFLLPHTPPLGGRGGGLGAFSLLRQRDHCVFFLVTALFSIPLAAFYMYSPEFLKVLGDERPTGTMTVAQVLEVVSLLLLGRVMTRFRVKTVLSLALGLSAVRYAMCANAGVTGIIDWHIAGIALHGLCFTFYFVTAQVFLNRRVPPALKGRAQGLLSMVSGGLGPLIGALICGWLRKTCVAADGSGWDLFWGILAAMIVGCLAIFLLFYRGLGKQATDARQD